MILLLTIIASLVEEGAGVPTTTGLVLGFEGFELEGSPEALMEATSCRQVFSTLSISEVYPRPKPARV